MKPLSFQARISLGFFCMLLLALFMAFFAIRHSLRTGLQEETMQHALNNLELVQWSIDQHPPFQDLQRFDAWLEGLGERMKSRITYIADGRVLADSEVAFDLLQELEDHSTRPEVLQAGSEGMGMDIRRSATVKQELMYVAMPVQAASGLPGGMLRLAVELSAMQEQYQRVATPLGWIFLVTLVAAMAFALLVSRALTRSIRELSASAAAIGQGGDYHRIRYYPGREFRPLVDSLNTMAANIRDTVGELEEGKGRLEALFNAMSDGVVALDREGRIESWNNAALGMFPELAGGEGRWPLEVLGEPNLHEAAGRLLAASSVASGASTDRSETVRFTDKQARHYDVRIERFDTPAGARLVMVLRDVSEQRRLEVMRRDFVANVSHELRTPITSIRGYAETLLDMPPDLGEEQRVKFLSVILRNAEHMQDMVLRLIELSKAEHKLRGEAAVNVAPRTALDSALATLAQLLQDKDVSVEPAADLDDYPVLAEEAALENIFRNLLENALKFGPMGQRIEVKASREADMVHIAVRDHGPGVPKEHQGRVFERFYRSVDAPAGKDGSAGLGLAICRNLVERFGGRIHVERPEDGVGARFVFILPAAERRP